MTATSREKIPTSAPYADHFQPPALDMPKLQAFMGQTMTDMTGTLVSFMCAIGDQLGLFKLLAANGPSTSIELASHANISERYVREWLSALTSAAYLEYDPQSQRFTLPPEHAMILAMEGGPMFMGGGYQLLIGLLKPFDQIIRAFREAGGVPQAAYDINLREGMARVSAGWFEHMLVQQWLPALPALAARLTQGGSVADVGCGTGRALVALAQAFPNSRFVGYDRFAPSLANAITAASAAGVADRVRFEQRDVVEGLLGQYDLITIFDALHDFHDPVAGLRAVERALKPDGVCLLLEMNCAERLEQNTGPAAAMLYGTSVLYNLPVSLADGGPGLGTMGLPESKLRSLCATAGLSHVSRLPANNPFHALYAVER
jgi:SAM-dependent methyltransferase